MKDLHRWPIRFSGVFLIPLLAVLAGRSQEKTKPKPGDVMIEKYLAAETDKLSKKFLDGAKTIEEWQQKRPRLYREYMDMLGLWPIPEKTPLKVTITGTVETPDCIIDNLHYQSKPGLYVTANLYRPIDTASKTSKKYPAVLYVCGHSWRGRDGNKSAHQGHGMWFAKNGYICLVLDTLQLGEIPGVHHGTYGRPWAHLKNYGIKDKDKLKRVPARVERGRRQTSSFHVVGLLFHVVIKVYAAARRCAWKRDSAGFPAATGLGGQNANPG